MHSCLVDCDTGLHMVTFCSWHGRALVAFGLLSSSSESLLLPHSSRAIAVGGRRPGLRITTRLWTDPATDGSGDSQSTQETRDALLSRLQQEKDDLIAKKLELEQALKAKENTEAEYAANSAAVHTEASDASTTTNSLGLDTTSIRNSDALSEDNVEAERAALLAEKAALLAESQELEQTLKEEAAREDKFIDSLLAETREGIRGVSIWGSKGRVQVYRTAVANYAKKLTPSFFVRLDARVAELHTELQGGEAEMEGADTSAEVDAAHEGESTSSESTQAAAAVVDGPGADLAALAEGLLLALEADAPKQAASICDAVSRAKAGLPPLAYDYSSQEEDKSNSPASQEASSGPYTVFVNGQPAGSGANLTQILQGLDTSVMDNLQTNIPSWVSESVRTLILESANRNTQKKLEGASGDQVLEVLKDSVDKLPKGAVNRLKDEVFKGTSYVVTSVDTNSPYAALILGNSRSNDTAATYREVMARFEAIPDLASTLDLLYTPYPSEFLQGFTEDSDPLSVDLFGGEEPEKAWVVVPKTVTELPPKGGFGPQVFAASSLGATALSCMVCALGAYALNPTFVARVEAGDTATVNEVIPLFTALLGLNILHELGHFLASLKYGTKFSPPFLVPSLQLGSFGSVTQFAELPKSRAEVFDVALMGPLFGLVGSLVLLASGLEVTAEAGTLGAAAGAASDAARAAVAAWPVIPVGQFGSSILAYCLTSVLDPALLDLAPTTSVHVHPWTVAGLAGILVNALQLLPTGRTDGGRMATAVEGRGKASLMGTATLGIMLGTVLFGPEAQAVSLLYFGTLVLLFQRSQDVPFRDEVTNPGTARTVLFYVILLVAVAALFPVPGAGPVQSLGEMPVMGMPGSALPAAPAAPIPNPVLGMPPL